ncbi:CAP domain-containing protein [Psychrobacter sp. 72-O-c]|uniref:CAP domain-containing protein n=1 Tax=Psychrobacter sp. 72-O-c TaxID=2774125 RepID=UPI00191AFF7E|nr:CAP domain-containing protein [Psychrobacter sp. 72-O-c]
MRSLSSRKILATLIFSTMLLSACGGGSDSGSSDVSTPPESNEPVVQPNLLKPDVVLPVRDPEVNISSVDSKNYDQAALVGSNLISRQRQSCGLGGVEYNEELTKIATQHAQYIQYVFSNSTPTIFDAHSENEIADIKNSTGTNNPFFSGVSFEERLLKASYPNLAYGVTENIAHTRSESSAGRVISPEYASHAMTKSLLAAPYHLRILMTPNLSQTGSGMVAYTPHNKAADKYQGYVFVNASAATESSENNAANNLFTYPCANVTDTNTALYNESPSPVKGTGRNLRTDPIGQPVYIRMPAAKTIRVSNIKFHDVQRNVDVPTNLLDYRQDPHKGTTSELPKNEAFILPLTDALESCEIKRTTDQSQQCGLYGNSEYRVSFDVLVDNKDSINKSFTFKTGNVNY